MRSGKLWPALRRAAGSRLGSNLAALGTLQLANYLFPIISIPYLIQCAGLAAFGRYSLAVAVLQHISIWCDFGFNLSAPRRIAQSQLPGRQARIILATFAAKLIFAAIAILLLLALVRWDVTRADLRDMLLAGTSILIAGALNPTWYLQGIQRMAPFVKTSIAVRAVWLLLLFCMVHSAEDITTAFVLEAAAVTVTSLIGLGFSLKHMPRLSKRPRWSAIRLETRHALPLFIAGLGATLYTSAFTIVLGLCAGAREVGIYASAEKLITAAKRLSNPLTQALYPFISEKRKSNPGSVHQLIKLALGYSTLAGLAVWLVLVIVAMGFLGLLLGHEATSEVRRCLLIMAPVPMIVLIANVFGIQSLASAGHTSAIARTQLIAGVIALGLSFVLASRDGSTGLSVLTLLTELGITIAFAVLSAQRLGFPRLPWVSPPAPPA